MSADPHSYRVECRLTAIENYYTLPLLVIWVPFYEIGWLFEHERTSIVCKPFMECHIHHDNRVIAHCAIIPVHKTASIFV